MPFFAAESGANVYLSVTLNGKLYLPSWIDFDPKTRHIRFFPNNTKLIGQYDIDLILTESIAFLTSTTTIRLFVVDHSFDLTDDDD